MGKARIALATVAARNDQPALAPQKVERVGAGFIRPQQGKPERESNNQEEEHRRSKTLPGFGASVAMISVQFFASRTERLSGKCRRRANATRLLAQKQ
jgi:hypothetical protein